MKTNIFKINQKAWDQKVKAGNKWIVPASEAMIELAKKGKPYISISPKHIPLSWLKNYRKKKILCLASGGGQQGPILAAYGADVTVFDASEQQLLKDQQMADKYNLKLKTVQGDAQNLSVFAVGMFDLIIFPVANCFIEKVNLVWNECYRVLQKGGVLISGFVNPILYAFDQNKIEQNILTIKYKIPYSDLDLPKEQLAKHLASKEPIEFSHTLEEQIGGQLKAGFKLLDFYEDDWDYYDIIRKYLKIYIVTRAQK